MLEDHHANEPADRMSGDTLRAELGTVLDVNHTRTSLSEVHCATSLCKVTLLHENLEAQRTLASNVAGLAALRAGVFYSYLVDEESPRTVLYVVREGHDIGEMFAAQ